MSEDDVNSPDERMEEDEDGGGVGDEGKRGIAEVADAREGAEDQDDGDGGNDDGEAVAEMGDEAAANVVPAKKKRGVEKADLSFYQGPVDLPKSNVTAIMRAGAEFPIQVSSGANAVMSDAARLFIHYVAARADAFAKERKKNVVHAEHVLDAVRDLEFGFMLPTLQALLAQEQARGNVKREERKRADMQKRVAVLRERLERARSGQLAPDDAAAPAARGRKKAVEPVTVDAIEAELMDLEQRLEQVALEVDGAQ